MAALASVFVSLQKVCTDLYASDHLIWPYCCVSPAFTHALALAPAPGA